MQNNNFAATLASVASEFGVEDTAKHGRGIKPSKRPYFRWAYPAIRSSPSWPPWQHGSGPAARRRS